MFEIIFIDRETGKVNYAITDVRQIRYINPSEVGFTRMDGRPGSASFTHTENLSVERRAPTPFMNEPGLLAKVVRERTRT